LHDVCFKGFERIQARPAALVPATSLALMIALFLPNVPQVFGYREYRHAPEQKASLRWRPNVAWALLSALALAISLFGMWQRLEFLYFQF